MAPGFEVDRGPFGRRVRRLKRAVRWSARSMTGASRQLLVELNWRLGDEIMALPVIDALPAVYKRTKIDVRTNYPDLFADNPVVRMVNPAHPDPDRYLLLRGASRLKYRLQEYSERAGVPVPNERPKLHYRNWEAPQLTRIPRGKGGLVAIAPGASWPSKRWSAQCWNTLAEQLEATGCRLIVLGQSGEGLPHGTDFTGATSVREAACLLHAADVLVCCDSGLMHLALAAGTPTVALFGPTDPAFLIRNDPHLIAICSTQSCQGFWNHADMVGAPGVCPEGHSCCLESISVDTVFTAVMQQVDRVTVGSPSPGETTP